MALTGIEIFKLLAKTNCKECGFPTCWPLPWPWPAGRRSWRSAPMVSEEVGREAGRGLGPAHPPIKIGMKDGVKTIGGETVMFRHEKTFLNPTLIAGW